jgi:VWFA-related protein
MRAVRFSRLALLCLVSAGILAAAVTGVRAQAGLRERTVFVSAVDSRGDPVTGLGPADFTVSEDGRQREVLRVTPALEPIDIAILVDNSAAATRTISPTREALRAFIAQMAVGNQIAVIGLADRPTILVDFTSSSERLEQGIGRLFAMSGSGMTLLDSIVEISNGMRKREAPRAVIVPIITIGAEFTNRYSRDVTAALKESGAALHAIVVGNLPMGSTEERERALAIAQGARESGGQHVTLLAETAIEQALLKLARELTSQYKVVYGRPESLIPPEKIVVGSPRTGVTMRGTPARGQPGA